METEAIPAGYDESATERLLRLLNGRQALATIQAVRLELQRGADPNADDEDGWTALMLALVLKHQDQADALVDALIAAGADVNHRCTDHRGGTGLMGLASLMDGNLRNHPNPIDNETTVLEDSIRNLLRRGANPYLQDHYGKTMLDHAGQARSRVAALISQHRLSQKLAQDPTNQSDRTDRPRQRL